MTTPTHEQEYICNEEQLLKMTSWATNKGVCLYDLRLTVANQIRSRPLSEELKRERVLSLTPDDASSLISYVKSCCYWNTDNPTIDLPHVVELLEKLEKIESLRSEP